MPGHGWKSARAVCSACVTDHCCLVDIIAYYGNAYDGYSPFTAFVFVDVVNFALNHTRKKINICDMCKYISFRSIVAPAKASCGGQAKSIKKNFGSACEIILNIIFDVVQSFQ